MLNFFSRGAIIQFSVRFPQSKFEKVPNGYKSFQILYDYYNCPNDLVAPDSQWHVAAANTFYANARNPRTFDYLPFSSVSSLMSLSYSLCLFRSVTASGLEGSKSDMEPGQLQWRKGCSHPSQPHLEARHPSLQQVIRLIVLLYQIILSFRE